ncbi:peptidase C69 [Pseudoxanthomonas kalamensis DSM 18571]|uniref:TldD/PmbA family protein n=1 Tax=Pseudoxanthomonas kalamensis TaxID=289483 RepID=UPI001391EF8F|nr:TldD/PmbA family protein [Pseudoxanthomonas kalamensis]KAF1712278.1 peptidase C69 [Pseudoxanthomonas kalamensis DSM 18571]
MSIFTEAQAKAILDKVISLSTADECTAELNGTTNGNIRFALNNVSTSGVVDDVELAVQVAFGKRVGTATINEFDDESLARVVKRAEDLARLAPENPEYMPIIGKQTYTPSPTFSESTAAIDPDYRAQVAADTIAPCKAEKLIAAGFLEDGQSFVAFANSKGNFGYQQATNFNYTCTVRTEDGTGSGWVVRSLKDASDFDASRDIQTAIRKASASADAKALEPGKYTVVLEPAAVAGLISFMMNFFDARQADEGRSFLSKKGGGNKLGEQVYDPQVNIYADPWDPVAPVLPWDGEGLPRIKQAIIENGKIASLDYSRFWAQKQGKQAVGSPGNLLMTGGSKSTAELVRGTDRGVLVTRTWYIRMVDPQTVLLTGLTRDGTFYIENGEIKYPIKNFRFNESPVIMLNNIDELGKPVRIAGDESSYAMLLPPMRLRDFTFTSLSDAV